MFKMLNPKRFYHAVGKRKFLEFILLAAFILFFYGPMLNMLMLAFANEYSVPAVLPQAWGFKWWRYVFSQDNLVSSIAQSFIVAIITTLVSMALCIPAAYSIARFKYRGRKLFMLSFLLTNAFPKLGIYTSIAVLFYRYNLMGTYTGVVIIHMINSMMFMVWAAGRARSGSVHRQQEEAARDVGAGPIRTFFKVTLPMAVPGHCGRNAVHLPRFDGGSAGAPCSSAWRKSKRCRLRCMASCWIPRRCRSVRCLRSY